MYNQMTKGKAIRYDRINQFCINSKYNASLGTWNQESTAKVGMYRKHKDLLEKIDFTFADSK